MRRDLLRAQPEIRWRAPRAALFQGLSRIEIGQATLRGVGAVLLLGAAGWLLALQGWKSRPPAFDMLTYFNNADALVHRGAIPRVGDVSSYGSFSPPGTSWFMALGLFVFNDPRLYEKVGSGLLYIGTLLGVFFLARAAFGSRCAYLAIVLYALSSLGLSIAGSLWPIGHPFFYVWMGYLAVQWVKRQQGRYLAAALLVWVIGMNVDMTIAPAVLALPVVWLVYRPPLLSRSLLVAGALGMAVWFPYLQFTAGRGFTDLSSQLLRQSIVPANYQAAWCDPALTLQSADGTATQTDAGASPGQASVANAPGLGQRLSQRLGVVREGLVANYTGAVPTSLAAVALMLMTLATLTVVAVNAFARPALGFVRRYAPRRTGIAKRTKWLDSRYEATDQPARERLQSAAVLLIILAIPWLLLLAAAEPDKPERYYWLWPLQVIALAAFVTNVFTQSRAPRAIVWIAGLAVALMLLWGPVSDRVEPALHGNWSGADPTTVQAMDLVANDLRTQGKTETSVGYQLYVYQFMPAYNAIDSHYKAGADLDLLLRFQHGITNTNTCAEGVAPGDEYRIVQSRPDADPAAPRERFNVALGNDYHMLGQAGAFQVFKRN
ncbi:MAG TPA: glycosyltransferase family 39 protein [Nitrolancea sp.]|nr:glycosyltransferase family 39 protein [Nitrolancea sp.]